MTVQKIGAGDFPRTSPNKKALAPSSTPKKHLPPSRRDLLHAFMTATAGNAYGWNYREVRPLPLPPKLSHGVNADCSFGIKILCDWAGIKDPTGDSYDGYGNSVSIYHALQKLAGLDNSTAPTAKALTAAQVGDILLFGPNGAWHATMVYKAGADPLLWSHGHQGAPNIYPLSADNRRPISVCNLNI